MSKVRLPLLNTKKGDSPICSGVLKANGRAFWLRTREICGFESHPEYNKPLWWNADTLGLSPSAQYGCAGSNPVGGTMKHVTTLSTPRSGHNFVIHNVISWFSDEYEHHNMENLLPRDIKPYHIEHPGYKIIIWRDFDDWIASMLPYLFPDQVPRIINEQIIKYIDIWIAIQYECYSPFYFHHDYAIHYDTFVSSVKYRKDLCSHMHGTYSEDKLDFVPANGSGSSFDKRRMDGSGSKMNVLNRAKQIKGTKYEKLFNLIMHTYG